MLALFFQLKKACDQALYCLYGHPNKRSKLKHLVDHGVPNVDLTWERCVSPYVYLRPEKLPEFDDFKSSSILTDTVAFYKKIVDLIPAQFPDIESRQRQVEEWLKSGNTRNFPNTFQVLSTSSFKVRPHQESRRKEKKKGESPES